MIFSKEDLFNELNDLSIYDKRLLSLIFAIFTDNTNYINFLEWYYKYIEGIVKGTNTSS